MLSFIVTHLDLFGNREQNGASLKSVAMLSASRVLARLPLISEGRFREVYTMNWYGPPTF